MLPGRTIEEEKPIIVQRDRNEGLVPGAETSSRNAREAARVVDPAVTKALKDADWRAHHLISIDGIRSAPDLIAAAVRAGWRTDDPANIAALPALPEAQKKLKAARIDRPVHDNPHRNWNNEVRRRLSEIERVLSEVKEEVGTEAYDRRAREELENLQNDLRQEMLKQQRVTQNVLDGHTSSA